MSANKAKYGKESKRTTNQATLAPFVTQRIQKFNQWLIAQLVERSL
jgi:hypothetical protein